MIDFLKYRYICYAISLGVLVVGGIAFFTKGFRYYVDFAGGSEIRISFQTPLPISDLRKSLAKAGYQDAVIQSIGNSGAQGTNYSFIIQVQGSEENLGEVIFKEVKTLYPKNFPTLDSIDWVGPEVGRDIKFNAILSVLLSLLLILLYVTIRSKYRFAAGAVAAIAHDMLVVITAFLVLGEQISVHVLAAILTVIGYSLNDSIVIFSRIRENMKKLKEQTEENIVNISLNQTLRRTLLTSFSTLLAVGSIFVLGGPALRGFSLAMLVGIVVGTYSSIYVASPVMLALKPASKQSK
ncbi:protein translocase subunit SecF [Candidatus Dependentiae bacterium]|nr:protein translocase subunit SecF [Candidatus Dependentiae bacterium]